MTGLPLAADELAGAIGEILGLSLLAAVLAGVAAFVFRWYATQQAPTGIVALVGLSVVAVVLNTRSALGEALGGAEPAVTSAVLFNIVAFAVAAVASAAGGRSGDRLAVSLVLDGDALEGGFDRVVRAAGRVITVELPQAVEDMVGYDPVSEETKTKLAGETFVFPRRLTVADLRERLITRLKSDYDVGHVDLTVTEDGTVEYLAVGRRAAGIGPTLPRDSVAVAIRADPAHATGSGDVVQVWSADGSERLCSAEVRATAGEVVTLAVDEPDAAKLDPDATHKLVTLSTDARPDREFASLLRAADETLALVEVATDSALVGETLGDLDVSVVAVAAAGEERPRTLPPREYQITGGESLYVVASPDALRAVESPAGAAVTGPTPTDGAGTIRRSR